MNQHSDGLFFLALTLGIPIIAGLLVAAYKFHTSDIQTKRKILLWIGAFCGMVIVCLGFGLIAGCIKQ